MGLTEKQTNKQTNKQTTTSKEQRKKREEEIREKKREEWWGPGTRMIILSLFLSYVSVFFQSTNSPTSSSVACVCLPALFIPVLYVCLNPISLSSVCLDCTVCLPACLIGSYLSVCLSVCLSPCVLFACLPAVSLSACAVPYTLSYSSLLSALNSHALNFSLSSFTKGRVYNPVEVQSGS